jgi:hypothetical protein
MPQVTAAFVCAICDPDNPRPASIMCSNNCGRYVCAEHAVPRKGPGSAMICLSCAEALGLLNAPQKPQPEPAAPKVTAAPLTEPKPIVEPKPVVEPKTEPSMPSLGMSHAEPAAPKADTTLLGQTSPVRAAPAAQPAPKPAPPPAPKEETTAPLNAAIPVEQQSDAVRRLVDPEPPKQSSETIVSQRGNTLQVPKVTQQLGRAPQPLQSPRPRLAQRVEASTGLNRQALLLAIGAIVLGVIGFMLIVAALQ